jgi:hypothetical protein
MSRLSPFKDQGGVGQPPLAATSDSRLLDAAETLVTLQSVSARSGSRRSETASKSRAVYLTPHQQTGYKMSPQPPTSLVSSGGPSPTSMGPPPPPNSNVTFVLIDQIQSPPSPPTTLMRPPTELPPRRGRGRGRGRGSAVSEPRGGGGGGRGRGRGRGGSKSPVSSVQQSEVEIEADLNISQEDAEMNEAGEIKEAPKEDATFMVGNLELKESIFDNVLNKRKLELMMDPEVLAILSGQQKQLKSSKGTK